jgi:hypothetical protein
LSSNDGQPSRSTQTQEKQIMKITTISRRLVAVKTYLSILTLNVFGCERANYLPSVTISGVTSCQADGQSAGLLLVPLLAVMLLAAGCSSVSVHPDPVPPTATHAQAEAPRKIIVEDFSFAGADVRADRDGKELEDFKQKVNNDLTHALSKSIVKLGLPVEICKRKEDTFSPQPAWLIRGRYLRVYQGSRALRGFVGFGAGGTKVETAVAVYDLSVSTQVPIFTFETTGGSGAEPGGLLAINPVGFVVGTAGKSVKGLSDDTKRTARMISAYLSEALFKQGYILPDNVRFAKMLASGSPIPGQ